MQEMEETQVQSLGWEDPLEDPWFTCHEFTHFLLHKMVWQEPWGSYSALCLCAWEPLSARHFKLLTQRSWGVGVNPSELSTQSPVS